MTSKDAEDADDLRATAEDIIADAEKLKAIEESKLQRDPESPAVAELSSMAEDVAQRIAEKVDVQKRVADNLSPTS